MDQKQHYQPTRRNVFIVRIWREESTPGWRGSVQHAYSGEITLFTNLADLLTFIESQAGDPAPVLRKGIR